MEIVVICLYNINENSIDMMNLLHNMHAKPLLDEENTDAKENDRNNWAEIQKLRIIAAKVIEYKSISHPEVFISKRLDEKLNVYMRYLNNLDTIAPEE